MDDRKHSISPHALYARLGSETAPIVVDVRRDDDFALADQLALDQLATMVGGADTSRHDLGPQCGGLFAISLGPSANFPDDHEMLKHGMVIYDALCTRCRTLQAETHNWPSTKWT